MFLSHTYRLLTLITSVDKTWSFNKKQVFTINKWCTLPLFFSLLQSCNFFEAKQQVFECVKSHMDGQTMGNLEQPIRYFHFNDKRLDISIGPVGVGLSGYECEKNEFVFTCSDLKKDNFDDQITLDRFTLAAQQVIRSSEKTTVIDYSCKKLNRLVE